MSEKSEYAHPRPAACTFSGNEVLLLNPAPGSIKLVDIAEGLAKCCRYSGQLPDKFYSVAEHSVLVSRFVPNKLALMALFHDASEAITGDFASPFKALIRSYTDIVDIVEDTLTRAIFKEFGIEPYSDEDPIHPEVHDADSYLFVQERNQLMPDAPWWRKYGGGDPAYQQIPCHDWRMARQMFLARFKELIGGGFKSSQG